MATDLALPAPPVGALAPRILLLEDDTLVAKSIRRMLTRRDYEVDMAGDPVEALGLFRAVAYDVIISDINLPIRSGIDFLEEINKRSPGLPVILITGKPTVETAMDAVAHNAFLYMAKPFRAAELREAVSKAIAHGRIGKLQSQAAEMRGRGSTDEGSANDRFSRALDSLWFAYQPVADRNWNIFGYEALLRCDEESLKNPRAFLAAAEQLGRQDELLSRIRSVVTEPVLRQPDKTLFLNLHPSHFQLEDHNDPRDPFGQHRERIVLEITQRHPLASDADMTVFMSELRELGYHIAVDDVAAGSGGDHLGQMGPDFIKLNGSLVRDVGKHWQRQRIIQGVCEMCKEFDKKVVAERVEHSSEFEKLKELGCDYFQGFFIGKPEPL